MISAIKRKISTNQKRNIKRPYFLFDLLRNGLIDTWLYAKHSSTLYDYYQQDKLGAQLYKECHRIEKGLSLAEVRLGFGEQVFRTIHQHLVELEKLKVDCEARSYAGSIVQKYLEIHRDFDLSPKLETLLNSISGMTNHDREGVGTLSLTRAEFLAGGCGNFEEIVSTRHSIRQYSDEDVSPALLKQATHLASRTPSVCNRQAFKVRFFTNKERVQQLLKYQNGNLAFREQIPVVAVVSADLRFFGGVGERNQAYVDGGLFAMSLAFGLHHVGLGTCFLNWSVRQQVDRKFRAASEIPENEVIITLMSVGNIKDAFKVAASPNKDFASLYIVIDD